MAEIRSGMVIFASTSGQVITTAISSLTFVTDPGINGDVRVFFGYGGKAFVSRAEYESIHHEFGFPSSSMVFNKPNKPNTPVSSKKDDDDFTIPA